MGGKLVRQPSGGFAWFSSIVENFTCVAMTEEELMRKCGGDYAVARRMLRAAVDDLPWHEGIEPSTDGLGRWRYAIQVIRAIHGKRDELAAEERMVRYPGQPIDASFLAGSVREEEAVRNLGEAIGYDDLIRLAGKLRGPMVRDRKPVTMLNGPLSKHDALEAVREHARALWVDHTFGSAVLNNDLSVHDAADVFREQLYLMLEARRIVEAAGPCSVCGKQPGHSNHFDETVGHVLLKGHAYKS